MSLLSFVFFLFLIDYSIRKLVLSYVSHLEYFQSNFRVRQPSFLLVSMLVKSSENQIALLEPHSSLNCRTVAFIGLEGRLMNQSWVQIFRSVLHLISLLLWVELIPLQSRISISINVKREVETHIHQDIEMDCLSVSTMVMRKSLTQRLIGSQKNYLLLSQCSLLGTPSKLYHEWKGIPVMNDCGLCLLTSCCVVWLVL